MTLNEMPKYITAKELNNALERCPYVLLRFDSGYEMGVNSKVLLMARKRRKKRDDNYLTEFVSFIPCDFSTYITHKHPFM